MALCPKCGFDGRNEDQCERCGIIFDKMHTILEVRPLGAIPPPAPRVMLGGPRPDPHEAPTVAEIPKVAIPAGAPPRVAAALARSATPGPLPKALDRDATSLEVPLVPRVAAETPPSRTGPLLVVLVLVAVVWGALEIRESRVEAARADAVVANNTDAAYYDVSIEALLREVAPLRSVTDATAAEADRRRLLARVAYLRKLLSTSLVRGPDQEPYAEALELIAGFLERDVANAVAQVRSLGRAEPTPTWQLSKARAALARTRTARATQLSP